MNIFLNILQPLLKFKLTKCRMKRRYMDGNLLCPREQQIKGQSSLKFLLLEGIKYLALLEIEWDFSTRSDE